MEKVYTASMSYWSINALDYMLESEFTTITFGQTGLIRPTPFITGHNVYVNC
jgi:hypothetical protein